MSERKKYHLDETVQEHLGRRADKDGRGYQLSGPLNEGLARYFALLDHARRSVRQKLSPAQASLCADRLSGTRIEAWSLPYALQDVVDAQSAEKWGVDAQQTEAALQSLTFVEIAAVVDACERFWTATSRGELRDVNHILEG